VEVTPKSRLILRLQGLVFVVLFLGIIGMLAWLSTRYVYQADWTANTRNTISEDTGKLLGEMEGAITVTAFARDNDITRGRIRDLVARYQRVKPDIALEFVNPDAEPERVREDGITLDGELLISYQGRDEKVQELTEQQLTNALLRIARQSERWIVFLSGHGERDANGDANYDLGTFGRELERKGFKVQRVNLAETVIPENTNLLVIASPEVNLLPGEVGMIRAYVESGGNLLWLVEPGEDHGLGRLAELLGVEFLPGVIVDATTQLFGIQNPSFVIVAAYPLHAVTRDMNTVTVFPRAAALEAVDSEDWESEPILTTLDRTWTELGEIAGDVRFEENTDERAGPLNIGIALTRSLDAASPGKPREQRVLVAGDGDFLSNSFIGNGGNLDLGLNIVHWLSHDDAFIAIRPKAAPDQNLELGRTAQAVIATSFLLGLPLVLLSSGLLIWLRRRRR
jgi:ABC-type uncharacterized transport system involved in gliding motility auxiliary subunit